MTIIETPETRAFINFWIEFSSKYNSLDTTSIKSIALDSIWLWGEITSSKEFMNRYYTGYSTSKFAGILDTNKAVYSSIGCHPSPPVADAIKRQYSKACNCETVLVVQDTTGSLVNGIEFSFLQTSKGYRLFGLQYSSRYWRFDNSIVDTTTIEQ
ncbi:MAG: hypothetical protein IPG86_03000 [Chitinophagaceae bacterium]|nr:hypothetical protein [Chitinophagaceae bacterium]